MIKVSIKKYWKLLRLLFNKRTLIYTLQIIVFITMFSLLIITIFGTSLILLKCFKYDFIGNLGGLMFFIKQFEDVYVLITATLAIIGLFIAIERINLMVEANEIKASESWKLQFVLILEGLKINNPYMAIYFEQIADKIYRFLYRRNFVISNKLTLKLFTWKFFENQIITFEKKSKKYIDNGGKYNDINDACSIDEIKQVIGYISRLSHQYEKLEFDFDEIYKSTVKPFAEKNLDLTKQE